jgi:hypothetical protein
MPRYPQSGHRISLVLVTKFQRPRITQQQLGENANTSLNLTRLCAGAIPNHWMKGSLKLCVKQLCGQTPATQETYFWEARRWLPRGWIVVGL